MEERRHKTFSENKDKSFKCHKCDYATSVKSDPKCNKCKYSTNVKYNPKNGLRVKIFEFRNSEDKKKS